MPPGRLQLGRFLVGDSLVAPQHRASDSVQVGSAPIRDFSADFVFERSTKKAPHKRDHRRSQGYALVQLAALYAARLSLPQRSNGPGGKLCASDYAVFGGVGFPDLV